MKDPLTWSVPANLRWLAENMGAPRVPCGMLTGRFLISIAEVYESNAMSLPEQRGNR